MIGKLVAGLVALIENAPIPFLSLTTADMFFRNTAWQPNGRLKTERLDERRPAGELRPLWNGLVLETDRRF
jgi:hypothetical protein